MIKAIDLSQNWQVTTEDSDDFHKEQTDDSQWLVVSLEELSRRVPGVVWMRRSFEMPPNDECLVWWLELDTAVQGIIWINGQFLGRLDKDDPAHISVTSAVAMGKNVIAIKLENGAVSGWENAVCVPYPCE